MPRDLADVLHYFLPELDEAPPSAVTSGPPDRIHDVHGEAEQSGHGAPSSRETGAPPEIAPPAIPVLGLPLGDRDVMGAAIAWNLAVETARLGTTTILLAPESDRGSPLWPEPGVGPLGCELLFCPAKDLDSLLDAADLLASPMTASGRSDGIVFVRIPPAWLLADPKDGERLRWMLLLSGARTRDLDETTRLALALQSKHRQVELGVTIHGVESIDAAREAFDSLAGRIEAESVNPISSYGLLVDDLHVYRAIAAQRPVGLAHPQSPAARALMDVARLLVGDARSRIVG